MGWQAKDQPYTAQAKGTYHGDHHQDSCYMLNAFIAMRQQTLLSHPQMSPLITYQTCMHGDNIVTLTQDADISSFIEEATNLHKCTTYMKEMVYGTMTAHTITYKTTQMTTNLAHPQSTASHNKHCMSYFNNASVT
jgi:hypothetical protein